MFSWALHMAQAGENPGAQTVLWGDHVLLQLTSLLIRSSASAWCLEGLWVLLRDLPGAAKRFQHPDDRQPWIVGKKKRVRRQVGLHFNPSCTVHWVCVSLCKPLCLSKLLFLYLKNGGNGTFLKMVERIRAPGT